jgi:hypothetical protein
MSNFETFMEMFYLVRGHKQKPYHCAKAFSPCGKENITRFYSLIKPFLLIIFTFL